MVNAICFAVWTQGKLNSVVRQVLRNAIRRPLHSHLNESDVTQLDNAEPKPMQGLYKLVPNFELVEKLLI